MQRLEPMIERLEALGEIAGLSADTGYASARNLVCCEAAQITPYIASGNQWDSPPRVARFSEPTPLAPEADALTHMQYRLATQGGEAVYAQRRSTVEPVVGIIKHVMGFRPFMLRSLERVKGEWALVCLAWNMRRLFLLAR